jgi:hypothetical protein
MNVDEGKQLVRVILDRFYDGGSPVAPGDMFNDMVWGFWKDGVPTVLHIFDNEAMLRITSGVAVEIPADRLSSLFEVVSEINRNLYYGRAWAEPHGNDMGMYILMQEIVPLHLLSMNYQPSIDYALSLIGTLPAAATRWTPQVLATCGGKPWPNLLTLAMSG